MSSEAEIRPLKRDARGYLRSDLGSDIPFGTIGLDKDKLAEHNIASWCRLTSEKKWKVNGLPNRKVSEELKSAILQVIQKVSPVNLDQLSSEVYTYLKKAVKASKIQLLIKNQTKIKDLTDKDLQNKFIVYSGEIKSGNNSKELQSEFVVLLDELKSRKLITVKQYDDFSSIIYTEEDSS